MAQKIGKILRNLEHHKKSPEHMQAEISRSLFTKNISKYLQELINFMRARKRTAVFNECQHKINVIQKKNDRIRRIKRFSETRWTSHDRVVTVIHDKFDALKDALNILSNSTDRVTAAGARNFLSIPNIFFQFYNSFNICKKYIFYNDTCIMLFAIKKH